MPVTALYFLPASGPDSNPTQDILAKLTSYYDLSPLPPWTLSHRIFRETPFTQPSAQPFPSLTNGVDKAKPPGPRFLQILSLSHHAPRTFVAITTTHSASQIKAATPASSNISAEAASGEPATIISIAAGPSSEEFIQLIISKFGPLWQQRQILSAGYGHAFEIGDFRVRVGELRQGGSGGGQMGRGAVCEVTWIREEAEQEQEGWEVGEAVVKGFWEGLALRGAREVYWVPGLGDGEGTIRQWCELLRPR
ncbi:hypothetical protein HO133_010425 [Letharia lupina]|uniref:Mediator of RNA polymerase II transcription subunit 20 n=1 Tax=Letharia lupina TaxID=560253 RepID=A0A8H6FET2_9LECA|nr:uncharacterized protein HO133_010425 [Letharia lupina]KAF6225228.1 hypothetical protein HO133_010425 [Letharia lupina]